MYRRYLNGKHGFRPTTWAQPPGILARYAVLVATCLLPIAGVGAGVGAAAELKVVTAPGALSGTTGARLVADYGSYSLYLVDENTLKGLQSARGTHLNVAADMDRIKFERFTLDSKRFSLDAIPTSLRTESPQTPGLQLIQLAGPIKQSWLRAVEDTGARLVHYLANNAYLIWADDAALARIAGLQRSPAGAAGVAPIQLRLPHQPYFKLGASLANRVVQQKNGNALVKLTIQVYRHGGSSETDGFIRARTKSKWAPDQEILHYRNIHVEIAAGDLAAVAGRPDVVWMGERFERTLGDEVQGQIVAGNLNADRSGPSGTGYLAWLDAIGLGTNPDDYPIVDIVDDGIGDGTLSAGDPALHEGGRLGNPTRLAYVHNCTDAPDGGGPDGHGHINVGIAGGYDQSTGFPYLDPLGFQRGLGISPYGRFAGTRVFSPTGFDLSACGDTDTGLIQSSWQSGARIASNSWGCEACAGSYDDSSQAFDIGVRDADPDTPGNQSLILVFSAGNSGDSAGTIGSPGNGKNMITVGASESARPSDEDGNWTDGCAVGPTGADNAMDVIDFSSRGPAPGGRVKPEVIAPGTHVQARASTNAAYNGEGVCDQYRPGGQTLFAASSGTSHSTPAVAGIISLYYPWLQSQYGMTPSPALAKAYLMAHTTYLTGVSANDTLPSNSQGYGMPNLSQALDATTQRYLLDQSVVLDNSGETWTWAGAVADRAKPLRITLAYTDQAGALGVSPQVNNLDLQAEVDGITYLGNVFSGQWSVAGGTADAANNYEAIFLPAGTSGAIRIRVTGFNIAGDGVPAVGDGTDQDFALVCSNCTQVPGFSLTVAPPSLTLCAPGSADATLDLGSVLGFTAPVTLSATGNPAGSSVGFATNPVAPPGTSLATVSLSAGVAPGNYSIAIGGTAADADPQQTRLALSAFTAATGMAQAGSPTNGASGVVLRPTLQWTAVSQATSYEVQIATDAGFAHLIDTATVSTTRFTPSAALAGATPYFWRIRAANLCGTGAWSLTYGFTTASPICSSPGLAIPDTGTVSDPLSVGLAGALADLDVSIGATHTWVGDLSFTLVHEGTGTSVTLIDRPGDPAEYFGCRRAGIEAVLDDEAGAPVEDVCGETEPTIAGTFSPNQALSAFDGENLSGTWRLYATDAEVGETGTLDEWCLIPTLAAALFGDLDADRCIGRKDLTLLLNAVRDGTTVPAIQDINRDGAVNRADSRALMLLYTHPTGACP